MIERQAQLACNPSSNWKELYLNWSIGHLLTVIKTICVEDDPQVGLSDKINRTEIG